MLRSDVDDVFNLFPFVHIEFDEPFFFLVQLSLPATDVL